jgi:hypothetical protein
MARAPSIHVVGARWQGSCQIDSMHVSFVCCWQYWVSEIAVLSSHGYDLLAGVLSYLHRLIETAYAAVFDCWKY